MRVLNIPLMTVAAMGLALPSNAEYIYSLSFDAVAGVLQSGVAFHHSADSFSFVVPSLLTADQLIFLSSPRDLNSFEFSYVSFDWENDRQSFSLVPVGPIGEPGDVSGFEFVVFGVTGIGSYPTNLAGRLIYWPEDSPPARTVSTTGSLTVATSEPATLFLIGTALPALLVGRLRRSH